MDTGTRPRRGRAAALVGAGLVGGIVLAGYHVASAQTSPSPSPSTGSDQGPPRGFGGPGGPGGHHGGPGMGIHGEFTTAAPNGGYQTIATQVGDVTAVSATSVTVKSEDGFSRTYVVDDNTLVNAGNDGIADVKKGDKVRVTALVSGGKANAVDLDDGTNVDQLRGRWQPRPPRPPAGSGTTTPSSAT